MYSYCYFSLSRQISVGSWELGVLLKRSLFQIMAAMNKCSIWLFVVIDPDAKTSLMG